MKGQKMDLYDTLKICEAHDKMGWAVQEQLVSVIDLGLEEALERGKLNMNALSYIEEFLEVCGRYGVEDADDALETIREEKKSIEA